MKKNKKNIVRALKYISLMPIIASAPMLHSKAPNNVAAKINGIPSSLHEQKIHAIVVKNLSALPTNPNNDDLRNAFFAIQQELLAYIRAIPQSHPFNDLEKALKELNLENAIKVVNSIKAILTKLPNETKTHILSIMPPTHRLLFGF